MWLSLGSSTHHGVLRDLLYHPYALLPASGCVLTGLALGAVLFAILRAVLSPLRSVPGPFLARFTDLWYLWRLYQGHFEEEQLNLHRKYGPIVRLGPKRYVFSDQEALKAIYGPGAANRFPKSPSYRPAAPPESERWTLFADEDIERHAKQRRLYQSTYAMSSLVTYEAYVDECADIFSLRLSELAGATTAGGGGRGTSGNSVDMGFWFQCFAFDVIGLITYSKRLGFLDWGEDVGTIIRTIDSEMVYFVLTGVYSFLHKIMFPVRNWMAGNKGTGRTYLMNFTKEMIAEHQARPQVVSTEDAEAGRVPMDFLSKFFAKHSADPERFTMYHVLAGCASNIVAGSDTTATSLSGILYHLLKNQEALRRLRDEIELVQSRRQSTNVTSIITWAESQDMPYLQAVIKEALRLHTAVALPMERVVPQGGAEIKGYYFPAGTCVGINNWVYHRDEELFGLDAREFRPERWLTDDVEKLSRMNRNNLSFGAGIRTCIGRHIAQLQMAKLIPRLISEFEFEMCNETQGRTGSWSTKNYFFLKPTDFRVGVTERRSR